MADALLRQIEMLRMIPRRGKITPQQLYKQLTALGYDTTERTVQRDLQTLSARIPILCDSASKPHGWYWSTGAASWNMPGLSLGEAFAFQMLERFGADLIPAVIAEQLKPYFMSAKHQIQLDVGPSLARNWMRKVRSVAPNQPLLPVSVAPSIMQAIHKALMRERCLRIRYRNARGAERVVHPLGLVQHGSIFYLVVVHEGYTDARLLAVHRICQAQVLDTACQPPASFDLDRYISQGGLGFGEVGHEIRLRARFCNHAGDHLLETRLSADQTHEPLDEGEVEITATVNLTRRLRWWLLAFGPNVEVLEPASLRAELQESLQAALDRYQQVTV